MKRYILSLLATVAATVMMAAGWPSNYGGVMMQGFYWDSFGHSRWTVLTSKADLYSQYFDLIWVPNSSNCCSNSSMGYDPVYWFNQSSAFGGETALREMINTYKLKGTGIIEDVVLNHKNGKTGWVDFVDETWNGHNIKWSLADICSNDEAAYQGYQVTGAPDTGENFDGARDLDHTRANVQNNCKYYLDYLLNDLGYAGFRLDMVKGYGAQYIKMYNQAVKPRFSVGEYWDGSFSAVTGWIKGTGYESAAFDFPLKYVINRAFGNGEWTALSDKGIAGSPDYSRYTVTFVDNHDTYRNNDKLVNNVLAANAFILALPGTPCIILPHFQAYPDEIGLLIKARKAAGINNESRITEQGMLNGGYVMKVQGTVGTVMCISGYAVGVDTSGFKLVKSGTNYAYYVSDNVPLDGGTATKKDIHVYINAPKPPFAFVWNGDGNLTGEWPGNQLTTIATTSDGNKWYTASFHASNINMVLNNGNDAQTQDINGISDKIFLQYDGADRYTDVTRVYKNEEPTIALPECATWLDGRMFCYFEANAAYTAPNAWIWNDKGSFTGDNWPGVALQRVGVAPSGNKVYRWDGGNLDPTNIPTGVVFNTGTGSPQTADFAFVNGGYYDANGLLAVTKKPTLKADVNGDGVVDIADVNLVVNIILGKSTALPSADVNGDGSIDIADVNAIVNAMLGK